MQNYTRRGHERTPKNNQVSSVANWVGCQFGWVPRVGVQVKKARCLGGWVVRGGCGGDVSQDGQRFCTFFLLFFNLLFLYSFT